jgi:hypothetical protein
MEAWEHLQPVVDVLIRRAVERGLQTLSHVEQNVYLVWCYPAAVENGGHASFFYNSYGEFAIETVQALHATGCADYAEILEYAIKQFPKSHVPRDIEERNDAFNAIPEAGHTAMESCDSEFSELGSDELFTRLLRYWRQRAA